MSTENGSDNSLAMELSKEDVRDFEHLTNSEDAAGMVIRGAIIIENQLIKLLEENLANPAAMEEMRLDFYGRAAMAAAIGMRANLLTPIRAIGRLRNDFAHKLEAILGDQEANNIYKAFDADDKQIIEAVYQRARRSFSRKIPSKFKSMVPKDRVAICILTLRGALITTRSQAQQSRRYYDFNTTAL